MTSELNRDAQQRLNTWTTNNGKAKRPRKGAAASLNRHGIYANQVLEANERKFFRTIIAKLYADFDFNESSDFLAIEVVAIFYVKQARALAAGEVGAVETFDRMIRNHLKDLKVTKASREGDKPVEKTTTPAEWAADLLASDETSATTGNQG